MEMRRTVETRIIVSFTLALLLVATVSIVSYRSARQSAAEAKWVKHTQTALTQLASLLSTMTDIETGQRGFTITGDDAFLEPYEAAMGRKNAQLHQLSEFMADDPEQQQRMEVLADVIAQRVAFVESLVELRRLQGFDAVQNRIATRQGKRLHDRIRQIVMEMQQTEEHLLAKRERATQAAVRLTLLAETIGGSLAVAVVVVASCTVRRELLARGRAEQALQERHGHCRGKERIQHEHQCPVGGRQSTELLPRHVLTGKARLSCGSRT